MSESSVGDVSINIKTINNDVYQFTVSTQSSVEELKALIRQRTNISEDRQRLIYRGRVLTDGSTIAEYHIENGHTIQFVARPENYRELQQSAVANDTATQTTTNIQQTTLDQMMREIFGGEATGTITTGNSETRQFGPSVSTPTALPTLDDGSLEHVRQGFLTLRTLLATMSNHDDDERNSEIGADSTPHPRFYPGQWVDVKDTVNQWLEATVMSVDYASNAIFVHYNGWPTRWDEWIPFNSPRIAPFRSRTAHSNALTSYVSPTPNVRISGAPSTGSDDVRTILPEIRNMLRRLQPMIEEAADIAEQSYLAEHPSATPGLLVGNPVAQEQLVGRRRATSAPSVGSSSAVGRAGDIWTESEILSGDVIGGSSSSPPPPRPTQRVPLSFSPTRQVAVNTRRSAVDPDSAVAEGQALNRSANLFNVSSTLLPQELLSMLTPLLQGGTDDNASAASVVGSVGGAASAPRVVSQSTFMVGSDGNVREFRQPIAESASGHDISAVDSVSSNNLAELASSNVETSFRPDSTGNNERANNDFVSDSDEEVFSDALESDAITPDVSSVNNSRLRVLCRYLCPLLDRFGRVLSDSAPFLRTFSQSNGDSSGAASASAAQQQPAPQPSAPLSLEETLLQLMGISRPPSPEPIRAYRSPIRTLPHTPSAATGGVVRGADGSSFHTTGPRFISVNPASGGGGANPRVEMHIAVVNRNGQLVGNTPVSVPPSLAAPSSVAPSAPPVAAMQAVQAPVVAPIASVNTASGAVSSSALSTSGNTNSSGVTPVDLSSVQSLHSRATNLLQQVQDISARSQQLNERTTAVTEYSNALHSIIRNINTVEEIRTSQRRINEINAQIEAIRNRALAISATAAGIRERTAQVSAASAALDTEVTEINASASAEGLDEQVGEAESRASSQQSSSSDPPLALPGSFNNNEEGGNSVDSESEDQYDYEDETGNMEAEFGDLTEGDGLTRADSDAGDEEEEASGLLADLVPTVKIDTLLGGAGCTTSAGGGNSSSAAAPMDYEITDRMNPSITERLQFYSRAAALLSNSATEEYEPESASHSVDDGDSGSDESEHSANDVSMDSDF